MNGKIAPEGFYFNKAEQLACRYINNRKGVILQNKQLIPCYYCTSLNRRMQISY